MHNKIDEIKKKIIENGAMLALSAHLKAQEN